MLVAVVKRVGVRTGDSEDDECAQDKLDGQEKTG